MASSNIESAKNLITGWRSSLATAIRPKAYRDHHWPSSRSGGMDRNDFTVYDPMNQDPFFFAAMKVLGDWIVQPPLVVYENDKPVKPNDPDQRLLNKPNSLMHKSHLLVAMLIYKKIIGSGFLLFDWGQGFGKPQPGPPTAIWPFGGNRFRHHTAAGQVVGWSFTHPGTQQEIPLTNDQFIRIWSYNWQHPMGEKGQNVLSPIAQAIAVNYAASAYEYEYIRHYGVPLGALETPQTHGKEWADKQRAGWKKYHDGPNTLENVAILTGGLTFKQYAASIKDIHPESLHQGAREAVCAVLGIPPALVGILRYANYANMSPQISIFLRQAVRSNLTEFQNALNTDYFPRFAPRKHCEFDLSVFPEMDMSKTEKVALMKELLPMGITLQMLEDWLHTGLPMEKLGALATTSFMTMNLLPVGVMQKIKKILESGGFGGLLVNEPVEVNTLIPSGLPQEGGLAAAVKQALPSPQRKAPSSTEARKRSAEMLREIRPIEDKAAEAAKNWYWKQRQTMLRNLFENAKSIVARISEETFQKYQARKRIVEGSQAKGVEVVPAWKGIDPALAEAARMIMPLAEITVETEGLISLMLPLTEEALEIGGNVAFAEIAALGIDLGTFSSQHAGAVKFLDSRREILQERITAYFEDVHGNLMTGFLDGETVDQIADRIRSISNASQARAMTMVRTEVVGAANNGKHEAAIDAGVQYKAWAHGGGVKEPRASHETADGETVKIDEPFMIPGETPGVQGTLMFPYDWDNAGPGEWCNCSCSHYTPTYDPKTGHEFTLEELFGEKKAEIYWKRFGEKIQLPSRFKAAVLAGAS